MTSHPVDHGDFTPRAEHVWVTDLPTEAPGILIAWRQRHGEWEGWCVIASGGEVMQRWVRASSIRRA